jgi:rhamnose transport system substrate-binding protein
MVDQLVAQRVASICIVGNDFDALQPVLTKAKNAGIKVYSLDSSVNPASRLTHVNQADTQKIGQTLVEAAWDLAGGSGEIAILSATSQASNQNAWIAVMQETLKQPKYANLNLVKIAYGDDLRDKSVSETEGLLLSYPNLKVIIAPTTVGIAAAGKVFTDRGLQGKVALTGLGLPSEMAEYIDNGVCPYMYLWNPIDVGYLGSYVATGLTSGKITGKEGEKFSAGRLGEYTITRAPDGGTEVLLGPPFKFDKANIADWKSVY